MTHRNIYGPSKYHRKGIAGRCCRKGTGSNPSRTNNLKCIGVHVGVCSPEQEVNEGLDLQTAYLDLGAEQVGEQITLNVGYRSAWEQRTRCNQESIRSASVASRIRFEPGVLVKVENQSSAPTIEAVTLGENGTGSVADVRVAKSKLTSGELLEPADYAQRRTGRGRNPLRWFHHELL